MRGKRTEFERLTEEETLALFREMRAAADPKRHPARWRLVLANVPLVYRIVSELRGRSFVGRFLDTDDAVQEGVLALTDVVDRFDPDRPGKWTCLVGIVVKRRLRAAAVKASTPLSVTHHYSLRNPPFGASSPLEYVPEAALAREDGGDDARPGPDDVVPLLAALPDRDARVMTLLLGLDGGEPRTYRDAGREVGVGGGTAYAIKTRAVAAMRAAYHAA